ncbi:MAG: TlpA disulfide reductase family protein [Terricaulis sp.]
MIIQQAPPEWRTTHWFNTPAPLSLAALRGRVVMAVAFQMLCPGCVAQGLPQALRVRETFREEDVAVIGLHTVFEHHDAMTPISLKAFLHEYRIAFPVGVDDPDASGPVPKTMRAYELRGTPTTLLFDRAGRLRRHAFGHVPDIQLGSELMALVKERDPALIGEATPASRTCTPDGCS